MELTAFDHRLLAAIEDGLPLVAQPYRTLAEQLGVTEARVVDRLAQLQRQGTISRFGVVVRHRALGYSANAMVVWDVPGAADTDRVGALLAGSPGVTLCYQRPRRLPDWPYNLFCMVHGRDRQQVRDLVDGLVAAHGLQDLRHEVLFSTRCFKQRGARYYGGGHPRAPQPVQFGRVAS